MIIGKAFAVALTGFVLFLMLIVTVVMGIEDYGPKLWAALGGRVVPPPDRSLAGMRASGNPGVWFDGDAYSAEAIRANQHGRSVASLQLDAAGWPKRCDIVTSSRSASLDSTTCSILMRHARFARDRDGAVIASSFTVPARWVLPVYPTSQLSVE